MLSREDLIKVLEIMLWTRTDLVEQEKEALKFAINELSEEKENKHE